MTSVRAINIAQLSGLHERDVDDMLLGREGYAIVRASEVCHLRNHYINNPTWTQLYERGDEREPGSASELRMAMGNALEQEILDIFKRTSVDWRWSQRTVNHIHEGLQAIMVGHIDGIHYDGSVSQLGEIKSTSNRGYHEVLAAIDHPDNVSSEQLERYIQQMRKYASMLYCEPKSMHAIGFTPFYGTLVLINRDTCDWVMRQVKLFDEEDDIIAYPQLAIWEALAGMHPREGRPAPPVWASKQHPICSGCRFLEDDFGPLNQREGKVIEGGERIASLYAEGHRLEQLAKAYKLDARAAAESILDETGVNKIDLSDSVSVTRYKQSGKARVDTKKMRADGIYEQYTTTGGEYDVMRFNVKG